MHKKNESLTGMHVRIPEAHITFAKRLAHIEGLTLAGYIDSLIVVDIQNNQDSIPELIHDLNHQIAEIEIAKQALIRLSEALPPREV